MDRLLSLNHADPLLGDYMQQLVIFQRYLLLDVNTVVGKPGCERIMGCQCN